MFSKRHVYYKKQHIPQIRLLGHLRQRKGKGENQLPLVNKNRLHDQEFAEYHRTLVFKTSVIPNANWTDVIIALQPFGQIIAMSVKDGIPLYRGNRENYVGRNITEVFDGRVGQSFKAFCMKVWRKRSMMSITIVLEKREKLFYKQFCFFPFRDMIIICAKHLSVIDRFKPFPNYRMA